ncbi:MAG: 3-dehydroquinate synthase [Pseudomonadota bacterium]
MKELRVELGDRSYPIYIGSAALQQSNLLSKHIVGSEVLIVTNETIAPLYLDQLLAGIVCDKITVCELPDGEQHKSLQTLNCIFDSLLENRHSRKTTLIALGGGVVGDMTGFASACYQRGVAFIQIPTTLLSQVDSSVGGKTAVNHPLGKNMIGAFYQPQAVIADIDVLNTLSPRQFSAGLAEVIKYGLLADVEFFDWLESSADSLMGLDSDALVYAVERSCLIKADIVARDETEQNVRALLNLGHTFGHAIETVMQYRGILHGEAVAIGMLLAAHMSCLAGDLQSAEVHRIKALLLACNLPIRPPAKLALEDINSAMLLDKKVTAGSLRLVLLESIGAAKVESDFSQTLLEETLATVF